MPGENDRSGDDESDSTDGEPDDGRRRAARDAADSGHEADPADDRRTAGSDANRSSENPTDDPPEEPPTDASGKASVGEGGPDQSAGDVEADESAGDAEMDESVEDAASDENVEGATTGEGAGNAETGGPSGGTERVGDPGDADRSDDRPGADESDTSGEAHPDDQGAKGEEDADDGGDETPQGARDTEETATGDRTEPVGESGESDDGERTAGEVDEADSETEAAGEAGEPVDSEEDDDGEDVEDDMGDEEAGEGDEETGKGDEEIGEDDDEGEAEPVQLCAEVANGEAFVDDPMTVVVRTADGTVVEDATVESDRGDRVRTGAEGMAELTFDEPGTVEVTVGKDGERAQYVGDSVTVEVQSIDARIDQLAAEVGDLEAVLDDGFERLRARRAELSSVRQSRIDGLEERVEVLEDDNESLQERIEFLEERHERELRRTVGDLVTKFVYNVRENLEAALGQESDEKRRENVRMAMGEFDDVLAHQADATLVRPEPGDDLDRERHRPIGRRESDRPENAIVEVVRPGVELDGEVFEKAKVTVSEG